MPKQTKASKLDKVEAQELHKRVVRKFPRRPVEVEGIDSTWCIDLVEMIPYSKENKSYKYILTIIDVLSRYAWAVPLKNKNADTVLDAITEVITKSGRSPKKIWCDAGSEFINKKFKANFEKIYHTYGEMKAAPIERFNRTLKDMMWMKFTKHDSNEWVSRLPRLMKKYNNRVHSSIRMTPTEGSDKANEEYLLEYQANKVKKAKKGVPKLKIGDTVRISRVKGVFEKGYKPRWSHDLYEIVEVLKTRPITYKVKDLQRDEIVEGSFYQLELQKSKIKWSKEGVYLPDEWS